MVLQVGRDQGAAWAAASVVAALGLLVGSAEALAAVRVCGAAVVAEGVDKNEAGARRKALDGWREGALRLGSGYEAWRVATERVLACRPVEGLVVCRASARPCTIKQVVPKGLSNPRGDIDT